MGIWESATVSVPPSRDVLNHSRCLLLVAVARVEKSGKSIAEQVERLAQRHREQELEFRSTIETHKQAQQEAVKRAEMERARNQLLTRQQEQAELNQQIRDPYQSAGRTPGQR